MRKRRHTLAVLLMLFAVVLFCGNKIDASAASKYTIYVNRRTNLVNVVNSRTGKLVRAMYCSTGKGYSTISGTYNTVSKMRWHALYHGVWGQYCTRIHGSYLFHSVWYYSTNKTQMSTAEYNKLGSQASAGCVRLAVVDAKWIYDHCGVGTKVVIGERRKLKTPTRRLLKISTKSRTGWDPTDPDPANPYYPKITMKKSASKAIKYGRKFKAKDMIKVKSATTPSDILMKYVKVKGKVNTKKAGRYKITYTLTDPRTYLTVTKKYTFTVKKSTSKKSTSTETTETTQTTETTETTESAGSTEQSDLTPMQ